MRTARAASPVRAFISAVLGAVLIAAPESANAWAGKAGRRTEVILCKLPPRSAPAYEALAALAGGASGEALEMSRCESWSIPEAKRSALMRAARTHGVDATVLGADADRLLLPMSPRTRMTSGQKAMMDRTMGLASTMGVSMMASPEAPAVERALTNGMTAKKPGSPPPSLSIPLNGTTTVTARRTAVSKTKDGYVWRGEIDGTGDPVTLMWRASGHLFGSITYRDRMYVLKDAGGGMHAVTEIAPAMLPPEHAPAGLEMLDKMKMGDDPLVKQGDASMLRPALDGQRDRPRPTELRNLEDAGGAGQTRKGQAPAISQSPATGKNDRKKPVTISLIVAYTKQAASYYGDIANDLLALAVEDANQSFRNSGLGHIALEVAHVYETGYVESGRHFDHVWRFGDKGDGYMEEIHGLRDAYKADVAVLVAHDPAGCGLATRVAAEAEEAFVVVHHECAATMYSLGHEIGHIIGARHDRALDRSAGPFPYGHGFVNGKKWRTMMAYKDACGDCPRVPVWSSPDVRVKGARAGTRAADNAKVLREQAARVAAFR